MNRKLHILFLSSWFPSRVLPTNGDFILRHAKAVSTLHKVTVIHVVTDRNSKSKIELETIDKDGVKIIIAYVSPIKNPILKFLTFLNAYKSCLKKVSDFDLVHLNVTYPVGLIALYLKWFKNKKYIISEHWTGYLFPLNRSITFFQKKITQLITKNASFVCPVSHQLKRDMLDFGLKGNYFVIPNIIDTSLFTPKRNQNHIYTILHISALNDTQKNITGILEVIKRLSLQRSDFVLKIIGNSNPDRLLNLIESLEIPNKNIELIRGKKHTEIPKFLQESDLYVSFSNYETFGIVMAEAIATGTPVISTATGILNELELSEYVSIVPINNRDLLLEEINLHIDHPKKYDATEMNTVIKNLFCTEIVCQKLTKLYLNSI